MIQVINKGQGLLDSIRHSGSTSKNLNIWWLGQSGFLIQWSNNHVLIDPYLSDSLTKKYDSTDKPHIRMTELVIDPNLLDFIDVVTSSHNHTDHLDGDTLRPILSVNNDTTLIVPKANLDFVCDRLNCAPSLPKTISQGQNIRLSNEISIHGVSAAHNELLKDHDGNCYFMGFVFQIGPYTIYHSGDTLWRDEIVEELRPFDIDIAILPINGNVPERRVAGNLNAAEAIKLSQSIDAKLVIPCHYHMFTFNTVDPDEFIELANRSNQNYRVMKCGERLEYSK